MSKIRRVQLHPISIKTIKNGHPWVTKDQFSERFPKGEKFLIGQDKGKDFVLLLHDPEHKHVKARVWSLKEPFVEQTHSFKKDLNTRIISAFKKRFSSEVYKQRENLYLIFGESDFLPGIFVQLLKDQILIQLYSDFWLPYRKDLLFNIKDALKDFDLNMSQDQFWIQKRADSNKVEVENMGRKKIPYNFTLKEFGITYKLEFGKYYDFGLYTDMSSIRHQISPLLEKSKKVLNLFAYTGAFSLLSLKHGAQVTSVDLSKKYMDWLEENISLNPDCSLENHRSIVKSTDKALLSLREEKFDLIICDPPSFSSAKGKQASALKAYQSFMPHIEEILETEGRAVLFLNTHRIPRHKFKRELQSILKGHKTLKIEKDLIMKEDCAPLSRFQEGDYLKGFILKKVSP